MLKERAAGSSRFFGIATVIFFAIPDRTVKPGAWGKITMSNRPLRFHFHWIGSPIKTLCKRRWGCSIL